MMSRRHAQIAASTLARLTLLAMGFLAACDFPTMIVEVYNVPPDTEVLDVNLWQRDTVATAEVADKLTPIPYADEGRYDARTAFTFGLKLPDPTHKFVVGLAAFSRNPATKQFCLKETVSDEEGPFSTTTLHQHVSLIFAGATLDSIGSTPCVNDVAAQRDPLVAGLRLNHTRIGQAQTSSGSVTSLSILGWNFSPGLHVTLNPDIRLPEAQALGEDADVLLLAPDIISIKADPQKVLVSMPLTVTIKSADGNQLLFTYTTQFP